MQYTVTYPAAVGMNLDTHYITDSGKYRNSQAHNGAEDLISPW